MSASDEMATQDDAMSSSTTGTAQTTSETCTAESAVRLQGNTERPADEADDTPDQNEAADEADADAAAAAAASAEEVAAFAAHEKDDARALECKARGNQHFQVQGSKRISSAPPNM